MQGNFIQPSNGALEIELYGVDDQVLVTGTAQIAGHLELIEGNTLVPSNFLEMPFLSADGGISGTFGTVGDEDMIDDWPWGLVQRANEIAVRLGGCTYLPVILRQAHGRSQTLRKALDSRRHQCSSTITNVLE